MSTMIRQPDLSKPAFTMFPDARNDVLAGRCPLCHMDIKVFEFRDELSIKEHNVSGLCQECQDECFS